MTGLYEDPELHVPIRSSCVTQKHIRDSFGTTFIISGKTGDEKDLVYGKGDTIPAPNHLLREDVNDDKPGSHLFRYSPEAQNLMERWGYDLARGEGLYFGRGPQVPPKAAHVPKGKLDNYYGFRRGLGYVSSSEEECCWLIDNQLSNSGDGFSSDSSAWDFDVSIDEMFKGLMVNMTTADPTTMDDDEQIPM